MLSAIVNHESGSSARTKINQAFDLIARSLIYKKADEGRTSAVVSNDGDLTLSLLSGESYLIKFSFVFSESVVADTPNIQFTIPSITGNAQLYLNHHFNGVADEISFVDSAILTGFIPTAHAGSNIVDGWIRITTSAAGTFALKWSNNTGTGTSTLKVGSWIHAIPAA